MNMGELQISKRAAGIKPSATLAISAKAKELAKAGKNVIDLGAGEPDFETPTNIKMAAKKAIDEGFTKYTTNTGIQELKKAVCEKLKKDNNLTYTEEQVIISNGAKQSLINTFLAILDEGDEVIIPKPSWVSFEEQVILCGAKPIFAETEHFKIKAEHIKNKITNKTKAIILNSPCNPTGAVIENEEVKKIANLCVKHNIICVSDETYEKIIYDSKKNLSIASLNKDIYEKTITINTLSKSYSMTGWRIGYCAGSKQYIEAMSRIQGHTTSAPSSISQKAALEALRGSQEAVESMRKEFEERRDYIIKRLKNMPGIKCSKPQGAFYAFPDITGTKLGSREFCEKLLKEELVAIVPGEAFGEDRCVRISFAASKEKLRAGMDRLERFCKKRLGK